MSDLPVPALSSDHRNHVQLIGRVSAEPTSRTMPSGDRAVLWRVVVARPPQPARRSAAGRRSPVVDTIECVAWGLGLQRRVERWQIGDTVECEGSLRRRFWRTPNGPTSRYEVEVQRAHRVRAPRT